MILNNALYGLRHHFARIAKAKTSSKESVDGFVFDLLDQSNGIGLGEYHGIYCFPQFIADRAQEFSKRGVTAFFAEPIPRRYQNLLDQWQYQDNPKPLIDYLNRRTHANSTYQFQRYWDMFEALKAAGIKVYGTSHLLENREEFSMKRQNECWLDAIKRVRVHSQPGEKFIVFGGRDHFRRDCEGARGVSYTLGIPAIQMEAGEYSIAEDAFSSQEHMIWIPHDENQIAFFRGPATKHRTIRYPG